MGRDRFSELVVATGNKGKLRELTAMLGEHGITVRGQKDYDVPEVPETGTTFVENAIIKARNAASSSLDAAKADPANAQAIKELGASEGALTAALGRLFALSEAYPDLKANQNMMQFQEELASTENKVAFSGQAFNDSVLQYNNSAQNFPNNVIAGFFSFQLASFLEIESEEKREVPEVSFT